jgi:hypothetical protein
MVVKCVNIVLTPDYSRELADNVAGWAVVTDEVVGDL